MATEFRRRPRSNNPNPFDDDTTVDETDQPSRTNSTNTNNSYPAPHDPLLDLYERRLHEDVDADFFTPPDQFSALNRVIDIIKSEIDNNGGNITPGSEIGTNFSHLPAY